MYQEATQEHGISAAAKMEVSGHRPAKRVVPETTEAGAYFERNMERFANMPMAKTDFAMMYTSLGA